MRFLINNNTTTTFNKKKKKATCNDDSKFRQDLRLDNYFVEVQDTNTEFLARSELMDREMAQGTDLTFDSQLSLDCEYPADGHNEKGEDETSQVDPYGIELDIETFRKHTSSNPKEGTTTSSWTCGSRRKARLLLLGATLFILLIVSLSFAISYMRATSTKSQVNNNNSSSTTASFNGTADNDHDNTMSADAASAYILQLLNLTTPQEMATLSSAGTPQGKAFSALVFAEQLTTTRTSPFRINQRYALAVLYFSTSGASKNDNDKENRWANSSGWDTLEPDECNWKGSLCNEASNNGDDLVVTDLHLGSNHLVGTIPTELCRLSNNLMNLDFSRNHLVGAIPECLTALVRLNSLTFFNNSLSGSLPPFGQLPSLSELDLRYNQLTGTLDAMLFDTKAVSSSSSSQQEPLELSILRLDHNQLTGSIPQEISYATSLRQITLSENDFTGEVPICDELDLLPMLEMVVVDCLEVNCTCCNNCND